MSKAAVSVLIPARNEEANIGRALKTLGWADEIWVVDSNSSDRTVEIAKAHGAKIAQFQYSGRGPKKKNWALQTLSFRNDWVLIVDADERIPPRLAQEIRAAIDGDLDGDLDGGLAGYYVNREYVFLGRKLRCFGRNWNLRLFRHRLGRYEPLATNTPHTGDNEIHEHVILNGQAGYLSESLVNEDNRALRAWVDNHNRYSDWEADVYMQFMAEPLSLRRLFSSGPVWRRRILKRLWLRMPFRPLGRFGVFYFVRRGFLDGWQGFAYAVLMGYYEFLISVKVREKRVLRRSNESNCEEQ